MSPLSFLDDEIDNACVTETKTFSTEPSISTGSQMGRVNLLRRSIDRREASASSDADYANMKRRSIWRRNTMWLKLFLDHETPFSTSHPSFRLGARPEHVKKTELEDLSCFMSDRYLLTQPLSLSLPSGHSTSGRRVDLRIHWSSSRLHLFPAYITIRCTLDRGCFHLGTSDRCLFPVTNICPL